MKWDADGCKPVVVGSIHYKLTNYTAVYHSWTDIHKHTKGIAFEAHHIMLEVLE